MDKTTFHTVKENDLLLVGGNARIKGEHILVREKIGHYVRGIDKRCEPRLYHYQFLKPIVAI